MTESLDNQVLIDALRHANQGQFVVGPAGEVLYWNAWMEQFSDVTTDDALGKRLLDLFVGQVQPRLQTAIEGALQRQKSAVLSRGFTPHPLPLRHPSRAGALMTQRVSVRPIVTRQGTCCMVDVSDVSQAVRREQILHEQGQVIEDARRELNAQANALLQANRDLRELAADVQAELARRLALQAERGPSDDADLASDMASLLEGLSQLAESTNKPPVLSDVELADVAADVAEAVEAEFSGQLRTQVKTLPDVVADPHWLRQVLQEVLRNAARFGQTKDGRADVSISALVVDDDATVKVFIEDSGAGLTTDQRAVASRAFRVFHPHSGGGMGLALCTRWMTAQGGRLRLLAGRKGGCVIELEFLRAERTQRRALDATGS